MGDISESGPERFGREGGAAAASPPSGNIPCAEIGALLESDTSRGTQGWFASTSRSFKISM